MNKKVVLIIIGIVATFIAFASFRTDKADGLLGSLTSPLSGTQRNVNLDYVDNENESEIINEDDERMATSFSDIKKNMEDEIMESNGLSYDNIREEITESGTNFTNSISESINELNDNIREEINRRLYRQVCENLD